MITEACYYAGLVRIETGAPPHRPTRVLYYAGHYDVPPVLVVDISAEFETKMQAIRVHRSQFTAGPEYGPETRLTAPHFLAGIEARAGYHGSTVQAQYGEPFVARLPFRVVDVYRTLGLTRSVAPKG